MGKSTEGLQTPYTKDFLLLFTSTFLFFGGLQLLIPAIPLYVERMGGNRFEAGLAVGTLVVSALLFRPAVGSQIDRRGGKRFLTLGCLVAALASLGYIPASSLLPLLFFRTLHGLGLASFATAAATLAANLSPEKRRGEALGAFGIAYVAAIALAPALGAWALNFLPFSFLFLASSALALLAFFVLLPIEGPPSKPEPPRGGFLQAISSRSVL
ncbi:MAG: MFS transporter, partial [Candidatus Methylomirabilales bacterium]